MKTRPAVSHPTKSPAVSLLPVVAPIRAADDTVKAPKTMVVSNVSRLHTKQETLLSDYMIQKKTQDIYLQNGTEDELSNDEKMKDEIDEILRICKELFFIH